MLGFGLKRPPDGGLTDFVFQRQLSHRLARNVCCGGLLTHTRPAKSHGEPPAYGAGANKKPRRLSWAGLGTLAQGCRPVVRKRRSLHRTLKAYSLRSSWSVHTRANCSPAQLLARALAAPAARRLAGHPSRAADRQRTARGKRNAPPDGSHSGAKDIAPPDEPQRDQGQAGAAHRQPP